MREACYCNKCGYVGELEEARGMWLHDGCNYSAVPISHIEEYRQKREEKQSETAGG